MNHSGNETDNMDIPACRDCRHCRPYRALPRLLSWLFEGAGNFELATCESPKYIPPKPVKNILSGEVEDHKRFPFCSVQRLLGPYSNSCGYVGDWFEPKEKK